MSGQGAGAAPVLGVAIVTYNAEKVILDCLESLLAAPDQPMRIVLCDNASTDGTVDAIRDWAAGRRAWRPSDLPGLPPAPAPKPVRLVEFDAPPAAGALPLAGQGADEPGIALIHSGLNRGFAGGVNLALEALRAAPDVALFWVLNPDAIAPPGAPGALMRAAREGGPGIGLWGGRILYADARGSINADGGGWLNLWTGVTGGVNFMRPHADAPPPDPAGFDFVSGASMAVTRAFLETVGPMREDYFLYYEEVDWALRRGDLAIGYAPGATIYHHVGASIGSPTHRRGGSPFSLYFLFRNRRRLVRRFNPAALPVAWTYSMAKVAQLALRGDLAAASAAFRGFNGLPPPRAVRERIAPEARPLAFGGE
ncbi:glycosyltransferase [Oceanicella actignis]|uniref:Glycosyltransferase 2-like domain-containing protein n=1 Tax=Oceanicella actignis TaxID=1189325 RepID=A0A1M7T4W8_9RHOB|nr:glycosyltransferase family 2 protein [Oceanicella actignis]SET42327.1 hypothetical protein SAMN04488119_104160 [Oceanicella actignis]SHN65747.1 hypothetical protein SAMN05216200_104160 [Oceanicella actignis]